MERTTYPGLDFLFSQFPKSEGHERPKCSTRLAPTKRAETGGKREESGGNSEKTGTRISASLGGSGRGWSSRLRCVRAHYRRTHARTHGSARAGPALVAAAILAPGSGRTV